jgi:hypothetical protein
MRPINSASGRPRGSATAPAGIPAHWFDHGRLVTTAHRTPAPQPSSRRAGRVLSSAVSTLAVALGVGYLVWYAVDTGLDGGHAWQAVGAVVGTQVLPGAVCWRAVRPRAGWLLEDVAMGFALGSTLAIASQVVAGLSGSGWLAAALPFLPPVALLAVPTTRRRIVRARTSPLPWWFGLVTAVVSIAALPQLVSYFARDKIVWPKGAWIPHIDLYLHQALAAQLKHRGPTSWPTVAGEDLGYHWFAHAWIAQTSAVSGTGLDEVLVRFMPALMPVLVVLSAAVAGLRLSGSPLVGAVTGLLTMAGGHLNVFGLQSPGHPLDPYSPTLALGAPTLMALVVVLAGRWRGEMLSGAVWLVPVLSVAAAGTKGSTLPLVVAGLALAAAALLLFDRPRLRPVLLDLAMVTASLVFTLVVVFHGSSAGLALGLPAAAEQTQVGTWLGGVRTAEAQAFAIVVTVLSMMSRGALGLALPFSRTRRRDPLTWLLVGATLAGAGAVGVFSHPGTSQLYFALTAIPLMAVGSALGLQHLARVLGRRLLWTALLAVPAGVLVVYLPEWVVGPFREQDLAHAEAMVWVAGGVVVLVALVAALLLPRRPLGRAAVAGVAVGTLALAGGLTVVVDGLFQPIRVSWGPVARRAPIAVTQTQIDAARYIRDHSAVDDLVMTNRHCTIPQDPFEVCDSRRWVVTAFSERQSLVEGWTASPEATRRAPHGRDSITVPYWKPDILRLNDGFIEAPTEQARQRLWDLGVRWVYVDFLQPHAKDLAPYATLRFSNNNAAAWQLNPPR